LLVTNPTPDTKFRAGEPLAWRTTTPNHGHNNPSLPKHHAHAEHGSFVLPEFHRRPGWALAIGFLALLLGAQEEKHLTVYMPQNSFTVAVRDRDKGEYVSLLDVVQPLGAATAKQDGDKWKLRFGGEESQFQAGKNKVKIRGKNMEMSAPVVIENCVALVPVHGLAQILPRLLNSAVDFREPARRLIVGGAATDFSAELQANPSRLVLHFSKPVNPSIASEPGRVRMTFTKDPVIAAAAVQNFGDKLITSASFAEHNGAAELTIAATAPLLAMFTDDNRTITLAAAPQAPIAAQPHPPASPAPGQQPPTSATAPAKQATALAPVAPRPRFLVVIDPAHGGDDRGALLAAGVEEKELTLALARRLRAALERNGVSSILLRDGDTAISLDQRAILANTARATVFVSVHAGNLGRGVRVYTARLADTTLKPGAMLPWETAQASYLDESSALSGSIAAELSKREIQHAEAPAQLRPLSHVTSAAVAIEFLPGKDGIASLAAAPYQQDLCAAVAAGIVAARNTLEVRK
jgi:N-acetylmuramoyl-L-alanine amidase